MSKKPEWSSETKWIYMFVWATDGANTLARCAARIFTITNHTQGPMDKGYAIDLVGGLHPLNGQPRAMTGTGIQVASVLYYFDQKFSHEEKTPRRWPPIKESSSGRCRNLPKS